MNLAQNIITNILLEKASIDWNNYLTPEEVNKFLSKDDKVEAAEEVIYNKKGNWFNTYWKDFKKEGWVKRDLVQDLANFYYKGHLNESLHLFGFVKDEDGNSKVIEDYDYPDKKSFENDLRANGFIVNRVCDNRDIYIMDHSDYLSVNQLKNKIKQIEKDIEEGIAISTDKLMLQELKDLLRKANTVPLNESAFDLWKSQIDSKSKEDLEKYLNKLYVRLSNSSEKSAPTEFYDLLRKIEYVENKTGTKKSDY